MPKDILRWLSGWGWDLRRARRCSRNGQQRRRGFDVLLKVLNWWWVVDCFISFYERDLIDVLKVHNTWYFSTWRVRITTSLKNHSGFLSSLQWPRYLVTCEMQFFRDCWRHNEPFRSSKVDLIICLVVWWGLYHGDFWQHVKMQNVLFIGIDTQCCNLLQQLIEELLLL